MKRTINSIDRTDSKLRWIDPSGNLSDLLLLSSVLAAAQKQGIGPFGLRRFNHVSAIFGSHPAVAQIADFTGDMPMSAIPAAIPSKVRAFDTIAGLIGLKTGTPENIEIFPPEGTFETLKYFNLEKGPVFICSGRDYPGTFWDSAMWAELAAIITKKTGKIPVQSGSNNDPVIPGALDLRGRPTIMQLFALIKEYASAVVCMDSYFVQAAKWADKPAVVIWGSDMFGSKSYPEHANITAVSGEQGINVTADKVFEQLSANSGTK
ncbi:MAG: hypothetical protein LLG37_09820 [Spirochaetia bacterium]|nr:hypothetical protein [Spirochaetia bacterium]